jgi:N-sulfoglucosamine sulfohydrolase
MSKPNIIYIHSHDTGRYIQPYGHAVDTPALQQLAEQGVLFRQNFCVNPTCSPSRAALLTGSYPHENGMLGLAHRGFSLNDYSQHIIHTLKQAGYVSALAGTQHIATPQGEKQPWEVIGYDQRLGTGGCGRDGAVAFLENPPEQPFFLAVGFGETHRPFPKLEDTPDDPRYCLPPSTLPDTPETREDMACYKACARILDQKIGDVLAALERSGKADETLVICTTDHGIPFPRMKCHLQDSGIGTFLMMRGPCGFTGGKVVDAMTSHLDIFPTLCDMIGIDPPDWLRGRSLLPLVSDGNTDIHNALFFQVNYHAAYDPMRAARTKRWKYIKRFDDRDSSVLSNYDDSESKSYWVASGWREQHVAEELLFDLCFDPNETNNLAGDAAHKPVLEDMRSRLQQWMEVTNDPLLAGPVPAPAGAKVNDANGLSPSEKPTVVGKQWSVSSDRNAERRT